MKAVGIVVAGLLVGCGGKHTETAMPTQAAPPVAVSVTTAAQSAWPQVYETTGTVQARTSTTVASRMMGHVMEVSVRLGDRVNAGQTLVTLETKDLDAQQAQAEAVLAEARSAPAELESAIAAAKAQLDLADTTLRRMQDLFGKKSISNQEFDEASAKRKLAEANYNSAVARRAQLKARIEQSEQAVRAVQVSRGYSRILAPFAGTVTAKQVEPGMLATPGVPLLTIEQAGAWRLEASIEESKLPVIRAGQAVEIQVDALGRALNSRVVEVVPAVDPASRTFIAKIDLPSMPQLRAGQFGRARFALGQREVLTVPASAVVERGQLAMIYVAEAGVARTRMVTLGEARGAEREVLTGLSAGDRVVNPVPASLADGARIEVRP